MNVLGKENIDPDLKEAVMALLRHWGLTVSKSGTL